MVVFGLFKKKEQQPIIAPQDVRLCKGCGRLLKKDEMVCGNCGNREKLCKYCGKCIPEKEIRCMYCGQLC
jgi:RNA polymerase subunit RPABC4/transcription elongation factor Spt4